MPELSCEGVDIFNMDFNDFEYPYDEFALTDFILLHNDDNLALLSNEQVKYYTLPTQVLSKIVFNNLLLKSGEYINTWGCAPLLIY